MTPLPSARRTSIAIDRTRTSAGSCWRSIRKSSRRCNRCCGRKTMLRISKWIAVAMLVTAPLIADDRTEQTLSGTVDYHGGLVTVEHAFGRITVHTWSRNEVNARAHIRSSDPDLSKSFGFTVDGGSNGVVIRAIGPSIHTHRTDDISYSADVDVSIPERAPLKLHSRFASVQVTGLRAPADIVNS